MSLGDRIHQKRTELNMTLEELAEALGYKSRASLYQIEHDKQGLPLSKLDALAKAFGVSREFLLGKETIVQAPPASSDLTEDEAEFLRKYRMLNPLGQRLAHNQLDGLVSSDDCLKEENIKKQA